MTPLWLASIQVLTPVSMRIVGKANYSETAKDFSEGCVRHVVGNNISEYSSDVSRKA